MLAIQQETTGGNFLFTAHEREIFFVHYSHCVDNKCLPHSPADNKIGGGGACQHDDQCFSSYCSKGVCARDSMVAGKVGRGGKSAQEANDAQCTILHLMFLLLYQTYRLPWTIQLTDLRAALLVDTDAASIFR
uniref:Uncharacterized protein n=1 Tax=Romanomermis culicivorax TaxID=13658 RepID=A0A915HTF0_ROMCU